MMATDTSTPQERTYGGFYLMTSGDHRMIAGALLGLSFLVAGTLIWTAVRPIGMPDWLSPPIAFFLGSELVVEVWRGCVVRVGHQKIELRRLFRTRALSTAEIDVVRRGGDELMIITVSGEVLSLRKKWYRNAAPALSAVEEALRRSGVSKGVAG